MTAKLKILNPQHYKNEDINYYAIYGADTSTGPRTYLCTIHADMLENYAKRSIYKYLRAYPRKTTRKVGENPNYVLVYTENFGDRKRQEKFYSLLSNAKRAMRRACIDIDLEYPAYIVNTHTNAFVTKTTLDYRTGEKMMQYGWTFKQDISRICNEALSTAGPYDCLNIIDATDEYLQVSFVRGRKIQTLRLYSDGSITNL